MFKLILTIAGFSIALNYNLVLSTQEEPPQYDGEESYDWDCEKGDCGLQQTQIKFSIDVPKGGCEDTCLGAENSEKISKALLDVLVAADYSYDVIMDLMLIDFMYGNLKYEDFADNIKEKDYPYQGYQVLQELVRTYRVCEKVCKVYAQLRLALQQNAANAELYEYPYDDGTKAIIITGKLMILNHMQSQIEEILDDKSIIQVAFQSDTIILDSSLAQEKWHGKHILIEGISVIVPLSIIIDVTGRPGDLYDGMVEIYAEFYDPGENTVIIIPEHGDEGN
ncbi:CLUMA_CG005764, isoform A [Clunio marinus]|uniref:CLUMA_CG005764, isoform A n=1 Tax=Clunio marinus TaxID=568069 RepID=A0A1J1I052_9DIPT|nr:CLUMA_CG005764, isoform A [Clunio marinus]